MPRLPALLALLALSACSGDDAAPSDKAGANTSEDGFPRDTLVIAEGSDANVMISAVSQSVTDSAIIENLYYPLADYEFDCGIKYKPAMAKSWEWNDDGTILRMTLRDDIKWADGKPVTAADLAFTMDLVEDPQVASPRTPYIEYLLEGKRPVVIDDTHIEWHFTHAYDRVTQLAHVSAVKPSPKHILEGEDRGSLRGNSFNTQPVVNGRWKIGAWDRGERIVLEPNEAWSGSAEESPKLKRVIFRVLPEYATRLVELETGGIDLMQAIQIPDADKLRTTHPEIKLVRRGWRAMDYIGWNSIDPEDYKKKLDAAGGESRKVDLKTVKPHPLFGDKAVRKALASAVDADKIIDDLLKSEVTGETYGRRSTGTITPELCDVHDESIVPISFDVPKAKAELAKIGWTDSNGDGVLDKGGVDFRFTLQTNTENPRRNKAAVIVQAQLKEVGITVDIERVEFNKFVEKHRRKDFDATLGGWSAGLFVDPSVIWHSGPEYEFNFVSYDNARADELMQQGLREPDPEKSKVIWQELQQVIYEDQPYLFLYWMDEIVGVHERFEDTTVNVQSPYYDLHEWWVPADKVKYKR